MANQEPQTVEDDEQMSRPQVTFKKYNAVVQSAELLDIRLTSSRFDVKSEYYLNRSGENNEKSSLKLTLNGTLSDFSYVKEEGLMFGTFEWSAASTEGRKRLLFIKSKYLVVYTAANNLDDTYVGAFLANVGKFATFPYFRALVATYSAAASANLPILPILTQPINTAPDEEDSEA